MILLEDKSFLPGDSIILDTDCRIISVKTAENTGEQTLDFIMRSLRLGDRRMFCRFCENESVPYPFEIFRLLKYGARAFVFIEKCKFKGKTHTACFLGEKITDFIPFMSPDNELYRTSTARLVYEILLSLNVSEKALTDSRVTPEALSCYAKAPLLFDELFSFSHSVKECNILSFFEMICENATSNSMFSAVNASVKEGVRYNEAKIYPINPVSLVHVGTNLLHILSYLSSDRNVTVTLDYFTNAVMATFSCQTNERFTTDCGSFFEIAEKYPDLRYTACAVGEIANALGFVPTIKYEDGVISIKTNVTYALDNRVKFKYDDPYTLVMPAFNEVVKLLSVK